MSSEECERDNTEVDECAQESPICLTLPDDRQKCPSCKERMNRPLVLSCLHVFCLDCLEKQYKERTKDGMVCHDLECEKCKDPTPISAAGIADLTPEYVLSDLLEMSSIDEVLIICTCCKAKKKAEARCQECDDYLCCTCITAHKCMHCFRNHKVITFEEMKKGEAGVLHRHILCTSHPSKYLNCYCKTCEVPICYDCLMTTHKPVYHQSEHTHKPVDHQSECTHKPVDHQSESIKYLENSERHYLKSLILESQNKIAFCEDAAATLMNSLKELPNQRDSAKDLINETFQSYKAILERRKDELLDELDTLKSSKELAIMDLCRSVQKAKEKLENGCKFIEHVLNNGSTLHLLLMKKLISTFLQLSVNNISDPKVNVCIEFDTDCMQFEMALNRLFGHFRKEDTKLCLSSPPSAFSIWRSHSFLESYGVSDSINSDSSASDITVQAGSANSNSSASMVNHAELTKLRAASARFQGSSHDSLQ